MLSLANTIICLTIAYIFADLEGESKTLPEYRACRMMMCIFVFIAVLNILDYFNESIGSIL